MPDAQSVRVTPVLCWVMIGAGAVDLIGWFLMGYGWTNVLLGNNILTQYGPMILIAVGVGLLRQQPPRG